MAQTMVEEAELCKEVHMSMVLYSRAVVVQLLVTEVGGNRQNTW